MSNHKEPLWCDAKVISRYSLEQAVADGVVAPVFDPAWAVSSYGKPIVATAGVQQDCDWYDLTEIWRDYRRWCREVAPTLPEEDRLFATELRGTTIWVLEDGEAFTILYPQDY